MRAAAIVFPGSNADVELVRTLRDVVGIETVVVWHRDAALPTGTDLVALPGGFAHGDYLRCGAMAKASPIMADVKRHAERGGLVLGICNGFQILTEAGLLPGALTRNEHLRFECRDVAVRVRGDGPFTRGLVGKTLRLPIAHAEGRYQADPSTLEVLARRDAIALEYVAPPGDTRLPANPNGSMRDVAGIYGGPKKNVFGLMPHPERMSEPVHGGVDGRLLFDAALAALAESAASSLASGAPGTA